MKYSKLSCQNSKPKQLKTGFSFLVKVRPKNTAEPKNNLYNHNRLIAITRQKFGRITLDKKIILNAITMHNTATDDNLRGTKSMDKKGSHLILHRTIGLMAYVTPLHLTLTLVLSHWRQPGREYIPSNILVGGGRSMGIFPPILLRTFGYSRPILVLLAQWQHLSVFYSLFCSKIQNMPQNRPTPHWGSSW